MSECVKWQNIIVFNKMSRIHKKYDFKSYKQRRNKNLPLVFENVCAAKGVVAVNKHPARQTRGLSCCFCLRVCCAISINRSFCLIQFHARGAGILTIPAFIVLMTPQFSLRVCLSAAPQDKTLHALRKSQSERRKKIVQRVCYATSELFRKLSRVEKKTRDGNCSLWKRLPASTVQCQSRKK